MNDEPTDPIEKARYHLVEGRGQTNLRERLADVLREYDRVTKLLAHFEKTNDSPQSVESDRNGWQRRLGVLVTHIESWSRWARDRGIDTSKLVEGTYRAVNADPRSGIIDDPYADIASMKVRQALEPALAAGVVKPGPHAPDWMIATYCDPVDEEE
jgi:hypothetical protein